MLQDERTQELADVVCTMHVWPKRITAKRNPFPTKSVPGTKTGPPASGHTPADHAGHGRGSRSALTKNIRTHRHVFLTL